MKIIRRIGELQLTGDVGLVPTMGALHDGHRSLFRVARAVSDTVVASLFVNPAQFDEQSDLGAYPHDDEGDAAIAEAEGVDVLFAPDAGEIYPPDFATWVDVDDAGGEGRSRPGHFRGVATVCVKLYNIVRPRRAYFGQKDAQQAAVLRRIVRDLNIPVEIRVLPTVRDADGLALSSRNARLSPGERDGALALPRALHDAIGAADPVAAATAALRDLDPDYVEVVDLGVARVLAAAVRVGDTRLIDNVVLEGALS